MIVSRFSRKNLLNRQPPIQAGVQRFFGHTKTLCPLRYRKGFPLVGESSVGASIVGLFRRCGPPTIARFIIAVGVDAVKRVRGTWPWPHVIIESLEGIAPPLAHGDTPAAIVFVAVTRWVGTPLNHVSPHGILWRVNFTMLLFGLGPVANTSTARCMTSCEAISDYGRRPPAIALAKPKGVAARRLTSIANDGQATETLPSYILYAFVRNGYNLLSHVRTSSTNVMRGLRGVRCALQSPLFYHMPERGATA